MRKRSYEKIWVKVAPSSDEALRGLEQVRMPWNKEAKITNKPVELDKNPDVIRMLNLGDIIEVEKPTE